MDKIIFLQSLAKCTDPFTGEICSGDEILHNPDVIFELGELSSILKLYPEHLVKMLPDKAVENKLERNSKGSDSIKIIEPRTTIQPFSKEIAKVLPFTFSVITEQVQNYLIANGYLKLVKSSYENKIEKHATDKGFEQGITNEESISPKGNIYNKVWYTAQAQEFVISLLPAILKNEPAQKPAKIVPVVNTFSNSGEELNIEKLNDDLQNFRLVELVKFIFEQQGSELRKLDFNAASRHFTVDNRTINRYCKSLEEKNVITIYNNKLRINDKYLILN